MKSKENKTDKTEFICMIITITLFIILLIITPIWKKNLKQQYIKEKEKQLNNNINYTDDEIEILENSLEEIFEDEVDETAINDFLWFERDTIAEILGYKNEDCMWRVKEYGDEVTVKIHDVKWDIDEEEDEDIPDLKTEFEETFEYNGDNDDLEETISDWLSDEIGYCHSGFEYEIKK